MINLLKDSKINLLKDSKLADVVVDSNINGPLKKNDLLNAATIELLKSNKYSNIAVNDLDLENAVSFLSQKIANSVLSISNVHLLSYQMQNYNISSSCRIAEYPVNNSFVTFSTGLNATTINVEILNINNPTTYQALLYIFNQNKPVSVSSSNVSDSFRLGFFYLSSLSVERSLFKKNGVEILQQINLSLIEAKKEKETNVYKKLYRSIY